MGYRCIQLKGIKGTQMTPYGANTTITGGYHNYSISENGSRKYSDYVEYIGENYLKHAYTGTQGAEEEINYVTVYEDSYFIIQDSVTLPYNDGSGGSKPWKSFVGIRILYQGEVLVASSSNIASSNNQITTDKISFCFVIDDDNHLGQILSFKQGPGDGDYSWTIQTMGLKKDWGKIYNILIGRILVGATIKVNYYLPDYEYTYAKITYKQDSEPASETDGESVEILKDGTSVNIEGLEEEKTYYFKIFTDKSESEAFPYTVEVDPVPPEYKQYIKCINGSENYQNRHCYITYIKEWQFYPDSYDPQRTYYHGSILGKTIYSNPTNSGFTDVQSSSNKTAVAVGNSIISVRITSDNDVYRISTDNMTLDNSIFEYIYNSPRTCAFGVLTINTQQLSLSVYNGLNYNTASWLESGLAQTFNSLTSAFDFINASFRNVNIYVDGVLWSKVN